MFQQSISRRDVLLASAAAAATPAAPSAASAQTPAAALMPRGSEQEVQLQTLQRRAIDAALWGMPAASMAAFRRSLAGVGAGYNDVLYFSKPLEARHEFITANNNTPYVATALDLHQGPMVIEVPAASAKVALFGSAIDSFQVPLTDVGPAGEDAGKGGKYLFLPPGYKGAAPTGYLVVPSSTYFLHVAFRPIIGKEAAIEDGVAYAKTLKVYPLSSAANSPPTKFVDAYPQAWHTLPVYDLSFFKDIAAVVNDEPAQERDAAMSGFWHRSASRRTSRSSPRARPRRSSSRRSPRPTTSCRAIWSDRYRTGSGPTGNGRNSTSRRPGTPTSWSTESS